MTRKKSMKKKSKKTKISSTEFDQRFEDGKSILEFLDLDTAVRRVNVDFPAWTIEALDVESKRLGVSRQALIKTWVADRIDQLAKTRTLHPRPPF